MVQQFVVKDVKKMIEPNDVYSHKGNYYYGITIPNHLSTNYNLYKIENGESTLILKSYSKEMSEFNKMWPDMKKDMWEAFLND
tara:strand:- start:1949 stop:2197 length:249 start_codon:yes stop_codon:yes gene_type:complete